MEEKQTVFRDYLVIVLLGILQAINYILFVVPNDFAPAGLNGITVMIQYSLNFSIGYMSLIVNVPLCIFAFFYVNRKFAIRTLVFCVVYSLFFLLFQKTNILDKFQYDAAGVDTIYPVLIAGLLSGFGYGCLFRANSSTGGTDIIAKYISNKKPLLNFYWVIFAFNAIVAFISYFVYADRTGGMVIYNFKPVCLCMLYCFLSSFVGNYMLKGSRSAYEFVIITSHPEKIEKMVVETLHHSATRLNGQGIYSGTDKEVLVCVVNKHQMIEFQNMIKSVPDTFAFINIVDNTVGNFKKIK